MDYIINKKLILEKKTNFISKAKKIKLKLNKYIKTPNYIFRKSGITNILYVDDTVQIEKSFKVRGALSEILNNIKSIKKKIL